MSIRWKMIVAVGLPTLAALVLALVLVWALFFRDNGGTTQEAAHLPTASAVAMATRTSTATAVPATPVPTRTPAVQAEPPAPTQPPPTEPPPPAPTVTPLPPTAIPHPPTSTPVPTPTLQPPTGGGTWGATPFDLAVIAMVTSGADVLAAIANVGTNDASGLQLKMDCSMERHPWTGGMDASQTITGIPVPVDLQVGSSEEIGTGFSNFDLSQWWYKVTCTLDPQETYNDPNRANNTYSQSFPPPP